MKQSNFRWVFVTQTTDVEYEYNNMAAGTLAVARKQVVDISLPTETL